MKFTEIETKYRATDIKLQDFIKTCKALNPTSRVDVGSWDHYYLRDDGSVLRYRAGARSELTVKRKSTEKNNFVRTEVNIPIGETSREAIAAFAQLQGYEPDFTIYKTCVIFFWDTHNTVFYVVYDENLNEKDRFIEIEMSEHFDWESNEIAWAQLQTIEKSFEELGIAPARRMKRSLQEIFTQGPLATKSTSA